MVGGPHRHQAKDLKYPLNENFLSLQLVILRSQLIFLFWVCLLFLFILFNKSTFLFECIISQIPRHRNNFIMIYSL
ncbi:hypothetical protein EXW51_30310 (plasmid) [Bacillus mycoides]|nr:hypothetical protein EXW51_30310 [Bacillus mycoides]